MKREQCSNCGELAPVVRKDYRFDEMGIPVLLRHINVVQCSKCGNEDPIIPNMNGLMRVLALAVICHPCKLSGDEVRFLRKYVGKSSEEFAKLLGRDKTHLSKVENGHIPVNDQTDKYVRLLMLNLSEELTHEVKRLIAMLPDIQDKCADERSHIEIDPVTLKAEYA